MLSSFFPFIYGIVVLLLLVQAFRVMSRGFFANQRDLSSSFNAEKLKDDRTGRITVHPELLDRKGRITNEELLTVRFSGDTDPPQSAEQSNE